MIDWDKHNSWIAVFDILGFKNLIRDADRKVPCALLSGKLSEILQQVQEDCLKVHQLKYMIISDTIVLFAPDLEPGSYGDMLQVCKALIRASISSRLPVSGAISAGVWFTAVGYHILIGPAFVEAYEYCEDQNWIGLLLTPSGTNETRKAGLNPLHHHFISGSLPLRNKSQSDVLAYRFQDGGTNFENPLLSQLRDMQFSAPDKAKEKYEHTIEFIVKHHRYCCGK